MKKRALLSVFASFLAAASLMGGCGGAGSGSIVILDGVKREETSSVTVFSNRADSYSLSILEDTLQTFMSGNSVIATCEGAKEPDYWQALDKRFDTDNLDDIFAIERDRLLTMTSKGALENLKDIVNVNIFNDFAKSQLYSEDGNIYAVPTAISTYGLYVNYNLLESNGFKDPTNFNEFESVCEYFKGTVTPVICNNYSSLGSLILAAGLYDVYCNNADTDAEIEKFNSNPSLLSEPLNAGIDFVYDMISRGWIDLNETALTGHGTRDIELFASGKYPFMITGGWLSDTLAEKFDPGFKYSIYPYHIPGKESVLAAQCDLLSVKKGADAEAKNLVSLMTKSDTLLLLNNDQSRFSPLDVTQIYASGPITQSINSLFRKRMYVIYGDVRLHVPLSEYLLECTNLILYENADAAQVKAYLSDLLSGGSADE